MHGRRGIDMSDENDFTDYQKQQKNVTANIPKDYEKELREDQLKKDFESDERKQQRHEDFRAERDRQRAEREKEAKEEAARKQKEADAREKEANARKAEQEKIAKRAETIKRNQEDAEKTREFREIKARNEARNKATADEQSALLKAKTGTERIHLRQKIDTRQRAENERVERANRPQPKKTYTIMGFGGVEHKVQMKTKPPTVAGKIKDAIRKGAQNTPARFDTMVTGVFGGVVDRMTTATPRKQSNAMYKGEMKQMSKVVNRRKVTGGPVKQIAIVHKGDIFANPDFTGALIGAMPLQTQTSKNKKAKPLGGKLSKFNNFVKGLF